MGASIADTWGVSFVICDAMGASITDAWGASFVIGDAIGASITDAWGASFGARCDGHTMYECIQADTMGVPPNSSLRIGLRRSIQSSNLFISVDGSRAGLKHRQFFARMRCDSHALSRRSTRNNGSGFPKTSLIGGVRFEG